MPAEPLDARERTELCDLLAELGPDSPTLCEGWATRDLAAHLVVRERDPRALPGIVVGGRAARYTESLMARRAARGYTTLVETLREGPPPGPGRIPWLRRWVNLTEWVVHHEDVRRANGMGPRTDRDDLADGVWAVLHRTAPLLARRARQVGLTLVRPDGSEIAGRTRPLAVRLVGEPVELALYLNGRGDSAEVWPEGSPEAVAALAATSFGI